MQMNSSIRGQNPTRFMQYFNKDFQKEFFPLALFPGTNELKFVNMENCQGPYGVKIKCRDSIFNLLHTILAVHSCRD